MSSLADYYCILGFQSIIVSSSRKRCCKTRFVKDSLREFMRLHRLYVQATSRFNARAVDEQVQRASSNAIRQVHVQNTLTVRQCETDGHCPIQSDKPQQTSHEPVFVCRNDIPNNPFRAKELWIAASRNCCYRPRLPLGHGIKILSENQTISQPIRIAAARHCTKADSWSYTS